MKNIWMNSAVLFLSGISYLLSAQVTSTDYKRVDSLLNRSGRVYSTAVQAEWIQDSHYFWYKNNEREGIFFYLVDAANKQKYRAKDQDQLASFFPKKDSHLAERFQKKSTSQTSTPPVLPSREKSDIRTTSSPNGLWEAYIKDHNVYIKRVGKEDEIALTRDGVSGMYYHNSLLWSPDSRRLATVKVRSSEMRRIPLIESSPESQLQPVLQWRDYYKPGDALPLYFPVMFDIENKIQMPLETTEYANQYYLYLTGWREDSRGLTFEFNERGHQRFVVGEINAADGNIRHLVEEHSPTFIHYYKNFRYDLNDGKEMLWVSERDGWRHLYRINCADGKIISQVTKGEWVVRKVDYVDDKNNIIYFTASGFNPDEDPYNLHYCRINMNGSGFADLTPENGNHQVQFSFDRQYFVDVYSRPDLPPVSVLRRGTDGKVLMELEKCDIDDLLAEDWVMPEVFSAKGRDGKTDIWGNIYRPTGFDPSRSYPVVEMIYAGPHDSHVDKDFKPAHHLISRLVDLGFIVVSIDGMGTSNRSKAFHDVCWKNLKDAGFPDRIAWMKSAAEKYPYMDLERVGIYGWSAGGQNAMAALLYHNDFYKAAVALCGCHDNRMDKIWWNEQWMGYPVDESYIESSNVENAHLLKGKLLLINGELDDNVDPASTLQVVNALVKANKHFDQLYLPAKGHSLGGSYEMRRIHDHFVKHLLGQDPPEWE